MTIRGLEMAAITVLFFFLFLCVAPAEESNHPVNGEIFFSALSGSSPVNYSVSPINVSVGAFPFSMAVDSVNGEVYVLNTDSSNVSVISVNETVVNTIPVPKYPSGIIFDPYNLCMYVSNGSPFLTVINTTTQSISHIHTDLIGVESMIYDSRNNYVYAFDFSHRISVIEPSNVVVKNLTYAASSYIDGPTVFDPYDNSVYFPGISFPADNVSSFGFTDLNLSTMNGSFVNTSSSIYFGSQGIVFNPFNGHIYAIALAHRTGNTTFDLIVLDPTRNAVTQYNIPGLMSYSLAYDSINHDIVVDGAPSSNNGLLFYFLNADNNVSFIIHNPVTSSVGPFVYNPVDNSLYVSAFYRERVIVFSLSPSNAGSNESMFLVYGLISIAVATSTILIWAWWRKSRA
ncbi:MAG: YncE family protein [Thermoplasmataceae archaeon]